MKIVIVSDNHGQRECLVNILKQWQGKVDGFFHCGDSELEASDTLWKDFVVVKGNCDYDPTFAETSTVKVGDETVFITHGHLYQINSGLTALSLAAQEQQATIALYGHSHKLACELTNGILFVNSGSISQPRGQYAPLKTYAIIETSDQGYQVTYFNEKHEEVTALSHFFKRS